jgi:hypothetical protein
LYCCSSRICCCQQTYKVARAANRQSLASVPPNGRERQGPRERARVHPARRPRAPCGEYGDGLENRYGFEPSSGQKSRRPLRSRIAMSNSCIFARLSGSRAIVLVDILTFATANKPTRSRVPHQLCRRPMFRRSRHMAVNTAAQSLLVRRGATDEVLPVHCDRRLHPAAGAAHLPSLRPEDRDPVAH